MKTYYYLAYGSNMNPDRIRSRIGSDLLDDTASPAAVAVLSGHRVSFRKRLGGGSAAADLAVRADGDTAPPAEAVLWRVTPEGLETLDSFEGVAGGHYRRETWTVRTKAGEVVEAAVYLAQPRFIQEDLRPTREYVGHLIAGADIFLSDEYKAWLRTFRGEEAGS